MINKFQKMILDNNGLTFSNGTLNLEDLFPRAFDLLVFYDLNKSLRNEILNLFDFKLYNMMEFNPEYHSLTMYQYHGKAYLRKEASEYAHQLWEEVHNYFNEISPSGYYFGSSLGSTSLIGWFEDFEEVCN